MTLFLGVYSCYTKHMRTSFDYHKAVQAINFMACKEGGRIDKLRLLKLLFFAERFHLRAYGRPIFYDQYWAMPMGPVSSSVKDIAEFSDFLSQDEYEYAALYLIKGTRPHSIESIKSVDEDEFSDSDLQALEWAFEHFRHLSNSDLIDRTHLYPEWAKYLHVLEIGQASRMPMDYRDFFDDPPAGIPNDFVQTPEHLEFMQEMFLEELQIEEMLA